nr:MAG TPA: hypothetical protein [Bacteriophage sp.]
MNHLNHYRRAQNLAIKCKALCVIFYGYINYILPVLSNI